jgi:Uma2 family endonuclease
MPAQIAEPRTKRWTREEYYRLAEEGYFRGQRVLLLEGEIIQMPPMGQLHIVSLVKLTRWLHEVFDRNYVIRIQMPFNALESSDPEPDAVVMPGPLDRSSDHPGSAILVVEVSDSSLHLDRYKAKVYAAAGVKDYWIIDVGHRRIEIYRNPQRDPAEPYGSRYDPPLIVKEGGQISPLKLPTAVVNAADLLP